MFRDKRIMLALFLLTVASGVYYPVSKIIRFEFPRTAPTVFRFKSELRDPYDPFRGRYVALSTPNYTFVADKLKEDVRRNSKKVYAVLENGEDGWAEVIGLVLEPEPGKPAVRIDHFWYDQVRADMGVRYHVSLPFNRFYMNEALAPEAERAFLKAARTVGSECTIVVKVYDDGNFAITDIEIDGVPIRKFLEETRGEEKK